MKYDPANLNFVTFQEAVWRIEDGWLAQYRGEGWVSRLIQRATGALRLEAAITRSGHGGASGLDLR